MPPLYRMPIVYLVLLLGAAVAGIAAVSRRVPEVKRPVAEVSATPKAEPSRAEVPGREEVEPGDAILRTPEGLRRKVLVRELGVVARSEPSGGQTIGEPLDYFEIDYVYAAPPKGGPPVIQIGPREGPPRGWVPLSTVLEWDTRLMARPTPRAGRPPLVIYREQACLLDALAGRACPKHGARCPIEGEEAAEARPGPETDAMPALGLPILQSKSIPQPDGPPRTIFEVASLVADRAPIVRPSEPPPDLRPLLQQVNIGFVIDTTASMQGTIDAARRLAETLVDEARRRYRDVTLRLGLVEYRDHAPAFGFAARRVSTFTDPAGFLRALDGLRAARGGDGSVAEAVLDGVAMALPIEADEPLGSIHLDWPTGRAGQLATKMLVLLGDAPDHDRDLGRARALADRARRSGITIAAVTIRRENYLQGDEPARYRDQWHALAEGSYRPPDRARGFDRPIPPLELTLDQGDQITARLRALIDDRVEQARTLAALAAAEAEGRLAEYTNRRGLPMGRVLPILADLHRGEERPSPRPDPRYRGQKAPSVRRGWIAEASEGKPLVEVAMLMSRPELDRLIDELAQFQEAAQGDARDLAELLRIGTAAAAGETAFLAADRGRQTFADWLRRRQGLPPARPESLLHRSQADLLQADEPTRAALDEQLRTRIAGLVRRRNEPDWDDPSRTIDGMALVPFDLIDF